MGSGARLSALRRGKRRKLFSKPRLNLDLAVREIDVRPASAIPLDSDGGSVLVEAFDLARFSDPGKKTLLVRREERDPGPYLAAQGKPDLQNSCASRVHALTVVGLGLAWPSPARRAR